jgi:predicted aconitase with swiveling domain
VPVQRAQQTSGGVPVACGEVDAEQGLELVDPDAPADLRGAVAVEPDEGSSTSDSSVISPMSPPSGPRG